MKATTKTKKPLKKPVKTCKTSAKAPSKISAKACAKNSASRATAIKSIKTASTKAAPKKTKRQEKEERYAKVFGFSSRICIGAFIALVFVAVTHLVSAVNVVDVTTKNGIPTSWNIASTTSAETIPAQATFFDQEQECDAAGDKYSFNTCDGSVSGVEQGLMKDTLGADGLPVAAVSTPNFSRWYNEVAGKSAKVEKSLTFTRSGTKYIYGGNGMFPLDDIASNSKVDGHNYYYTAHLSLPVRVSLSDKETFEFTGDDDAWIFVNGKLVIDAGGIHDSVTSSFKINADGSVTAKVAGSDKKIALGLKEGEIAKIDIFYTERNGKGSNTLISLDNMTWPAAGKANLQALLVENHYIRYIASVTNTDPDSELTVNRLAAYHTDSVSKVAGFLPLSPDSLEVTFTPNDPKSWTHVLISDPAANLDGFTIGDDIKLGRAGSKNSTVYFRFHLAPDHENVKYLDVAAFYGTNSKGTAGIAYAMVELDKSGIDLNWAPTTGSNTTQSTPESVDMTDDSINGNPDDYMPVYGETVFIPNGDTLNEISAALFGSPFDAVAHNYAITMIILFVFAGSFAFTYGFRRYAKRGRFTSHTKILKR